MRRASLLLAIIAAALGACGKRDDGVVRVSVVGSPDAFEPARGARLGPAAQLIRAAGFRPPGAEIRVGPPEGTGFAAWPITSIAN